MRRRRSAGNGAGQNPSPFHSREDGDDASPLASSDDDRPVAIELRSQKPRRIIDLSVSSITQWEEELNRALVVTVVTDHLDGLEASIVITVAQRFEITEASLALQRHGPASFLLFLPSEEATERVLNGGRPIISPSFRLHVMRWTRFLRSTAATLPFAVDVELRGIPAHAWEMATAEQLLNHFCWINDAHPDHGKK